MKKSLRAVLLWCVFFVGTQGFVHGQTSQLTDGTRITVRYGKKGFQLETSDGKNKMHITWRLQFRSAFPYAKNYTKASDFDKEQLSFWINRARMKVGGHAYTPKLSYYMEYDLEGARLLDYRVMYKFNKSINLKAGQWKAHFSSERIISSGKQQAMDRSIVNSTFTLDRQQGFSVFGDLGPGDKAYFSYWLSVFSGVGRGASANDDFNPLYMARIQWNSAGTQFKFVGGDPKRSAKPQFMFALAGASNRSQYTKFSSSGPGNLDGFTSDVAGQYHIKQAVQETGFRYRGFSWLQELHVKEIHDTENDKTTTFAGGIAQIGLMTQPIVKVAPKGLELFGRYAMYYAYIEADNYKNDSRKEYTMGLNYYVEGHRFKFTAESSLFEASIPEGGMFDGWRHRLQIEVSF